MANIEFSREGLHGYLDVLCVQGVLNDFSLVVAQPWQVESKGVA